MRYECDQAINTGSGFDTFDTTSQSVSAADLNASDGGVVSSIYDPSMGAFVNYDQSGDMLGYSQINPNDSSVLNLAWDQQNAGGGGGSG
jgi:hypothetical protein